MKRMLAVWKWAAVSVGAIALPALASAQHYKQTNLVSDIPGMAAETDMQLRNPWGLSRSAGSPWWVSNNGTGTSTLHDGQGHAIPLVVTIPPPKGEAGPATPTGIVFNGTPDFTVGPKLPAFFLFATEDGTISGWNPKVDGTNAILKVDNFHKQAIYKGMTLNQLDGKHVLYVANFHSGKVEVYDANFQPVHLHGDAFEDEQIRDGFAPFHVQAVGSNIFVTFAKQGKGKKDEVDGDGLGFVDVFSRDGRSIKRLEHGFWFNAPWGVAVAPGDFGEFSHDILVGNFGSGKIAAFNPVSGAFRGFV